MYSVSFSGEPIGVCMPACDQDHALLAFWDIILYIVELNWIIVVVENNKPGTTPSLKLTNDEIDACIDS